MSLEDAPLTPDQPSESGVLPNIENLADSEDADVIEARAKLLVASAKLMKASTPLLDKIIIRGILPIALAIVGPWALLKFDASQVEQKKQGETITQLEGLLTTAKADAAARQARSAEWRERMKTIEEEKSEELVAMATMVCRLDDMLKAALIQQTVLRLIGAESNERGIGNALLETPSREQVVQDALEQVHLPGIAPGELEKLAGQQYDRISEQRARK